MKLDFRGGYSLVFRAYEDGVAYRFISKQDAPFLVKEEQATFNLPTDQEVFVAIPKGREINRERGSISQFFSECISACEYFSME